MVRLEESEHLQSGEILVTTLTIIGWMPLFPRAAGIITVLGALLSQAIIAARRRLITQALSCTATVHEYLHE